MASRRPTSLVGVGLVGHDLGVRVGAGRSVGSLGSLEDAHVCGRPRLWSGLRWVSGGRRAEPTGGPVPSLPPGAVRKRIRHVEVGVQVVLHDELRDPVADPHGERLARVEVDEVDEDLAPVARVDGARRVDDGHPVPRGEPGARVHQPHGPRRQRDGDARRAPAPAPPGRESPRRRSSGRRRRRPRCCTPGRPRPGAVAGRRRGRGRRCSRCGAVRRVGRSGRALPAHEHPGLLAGELAAVVHEEAPASR